MEILLQNILLQHLRYIYVEIFQSKICLDQVERAVHRQVVDHFSTNQRQVDKAINDAQVIPQMMRALESTLSNAYEHTGG